MTQAAPRKSDLGVRVLSAVVMVALAGTALWLGGPIFSAFVAVVALGVCWEWWGLVRKLSGKTAVRAAWAIGGLFYIGLGALTLLVIRDPGLAVALQILLMVVAVDVGAYFAGRIIGGPKIAPKISPSKTWAGLGGGIVAASVVHAVIMPWTYHDFDPGNVGEITTLSLLGGTMVTIIAQAGDFFESWMKRRAGVKDSGLLIPGHGGLFDRVDGLLAVLFLGGLFGLGNIVAFVLLPYSQP